MKLMHIGDLHLGRSFGDFDLTEDQEYLLDQLLKTAEKEAADAVLIAGDVYDKAIPSEAATRMLDHFLSSLAERHVSTYIISGNHDSDERLGYGSGLFESSSIFISTRYRGSLCRHTLWAGGEEADIYLLPFVKASQVRHFLPEAKIETYDDAVRAVLDNERIDTSRCNILIAHQFVTGRTGDPELGGSEGPGTRSVGLVERIGYDCFDAFDYVALGHIHSPQQVGRREVRYSGSPLKYSLSEVNNEKSVPLITVEGGKVTDIELVPLKPMRQVRHFRGKLHELLDRTKVTSPEPDAVSDRSPSENKQALSEDDFLYVTLTDEDIDSDAMGIIRQMYPNTVRLDYDNSHTREIEQVDISRIAENRSFEELISDFYSQMYGCGISDEEMDIMRMVAREAGVLYEAG